MENPLRNDWDSQKWDAIVIGAGIGELNCACKLALADKKVLLIAKKWDRISHSKWTKLCKIDLRGQNSRKTHVPPIQKLRGFNDNEN